MFDQLPQEIGTFQKEDHNTYPNFTDTEVLLELVEHKVQLPIVSYGHLRDEDGAPEHLVLKFDKTEFHVEKVLVKGEEDIEQTVVETFPLTKIADAVAGLQKIVENSIPHACGAGCSH